MATAACVPVIAPIDAGRRVLEGRGAGTAAAGLAAAAQPHTVLFAGGASTLEPGAVEEEIVIQGSRCQASTRALHSLASVAQSCAKPRVAQPPPSCPTTATLRLP